MAVRFADGIAQTDGFRYGRTIEYGCKDGENSLTIDDLHATRLHLLGHVHRRSAWIYSGLEQRLMNV